MIYICVEDHINQDPPDLWNETRTIKDIPISGSYTYFKRGLMFDNSSCIYIEKTMIIIRIDNILYYDSPKYYMKLSEWIILQRDEKLKELC